MPSPRIGYPVMVSSVKKSRVPVSNSYCVSFFFFSSRRRHTRLQGDWSSDVCSSDLEVEIAPAVHLPSPHDGPAADLATADPVERLVGIEAVRVLPVVHEELAAVLVAGVAVALDELIALECFAVAEEIGRAHV